MKGLPPAWKVKREVLRLGSQSSRGLRNLVEPALRGHHDARFRSRVTLHEGHAQVTSRIAIFLVWPKQGLARSVFHTIAELRRAGFGVIVVSNWPLDPADLDDLRAVCAMVMERPNFGYDFGGYRDGVRLVQEDFGLPDTLLILNDSTWFPLRADDGTLSRILSHPAPYKGLVNKQVVHKKSQRKHLESHFLLFERPALHHPGFAGFWRDYRVSSDRFNTIRRGEYGISDAMTGNGFPMWGPIDPVGFVETLRGLEPDRLRECLSNTVFTNPERTRDTEAILSRFDGSVSWRDAACDFVNAQIWHEEHLITTAYIYALARYHGLPYLKKRRDDLIAVARRKVVSMIDEGLVEPLHPVIDDEVRRSV